MLSFFSYSVVLFAEAAPHGTSNSNDPDDVFDDLLSAGDRGGHKPGGRGGGSRGGGPEGDGGGGNDYLDPGDDYGTDDLYPDFDYSSSSSRVNNGRDNTGRHIGIDRG